MKRLVLLLAVGGMASVVWFVSRGNVDVSPREIARRCAESRPSWESYQEDIKGQIGAGPVAEWSGHPRSVTIADGEAEVDLAIAVPWADYQAAAPILLRDSFGVTCRHYASEQETWGRRYHFRLQGEALQRVPGWVELRYPHGETWVPLDTQGCWTNQDTQSETSAEDAPARER